MTERMCRLLAVRYLSGSFLEIKVFCVFGYGLKGVYPDALFYVILVTSYLDYRQLLCVFY